MFSASTRVKALYKIVSEKVNQYSKLKYQIR